MHNIHYDSIDETIYTETLNNGLTVALLPKNEMSKTYAVFATDYGSIDQKFIPISGNEPIEVPEGIAHFLEHKLFEKEDRDVFQDFGKQGASANAFTSFTTTAYLFSATDHIMDNVKTLIDFVQSPYFSHESVEKEKGIIAQEITMYDDQSDWQSFMGTIKSLFENHPVNVDIAGTVDSIQEITKEDLYTCYETFYHPENMTLFIAGDFQQKEMIEFIRNNQSEKTFSPVTEIKRFYPEEPQTVAKKESIINMAVSVPKCIVGIKEYSGKINPEELLKKEILLDMTLDYFYSRGGVYYQELYREELIDNSFMIDSSLEKNFGYTLIGGNTRNVTAFENKLKSQLLNIGSHQISEEDFEVLKKKKIGEMLRSMNSLEFIANQFIHYNALGIDMFNVIPEIEKLKLSDLTNFKNNWIDQDRMATCKVMPEKENVS